MTRGWRATQDINTWNTLMTQLEAVLFLGMVHLLQAQGKSVNPSYAQFNPKEVDSATVLH